MALLLMVKRAVEAWQTAGNLRFACNQHCA